MEISAKTVMDLRKKTGVSMMACKKALVEAEGDEEKAIEILKKRGETKSADKAGRKAGEGGIGLKLSDGKGLLASVRCETDFVSRNDDFKKLVQDITERYFESGDAAQEENENAVKEAVNTLGENIQLGGHQSLEAPVVGGYVHTTGKIAVLIGLEGGDAEKAKDVAMHAAAMNPMVVSPDEVTDELVAKEKEIWIDQLKNEGKPENIIDTILQGKEKKFREEGALVSQPFVKDSSMSVGDYLGDAKVVEYVRVVI